MFRLPFLFREEKMKNGTKLLTAAFVAIASIFAGCSLQSQTPVVEQTTYAESSAETPADREIRSAKRVVERRPDEAASHLKLAAAYLQKVRESGDYSLNRQAERSIWTAQKLEPDSLTAQILNLQILLSEHEFERSLALSEQILKTAPDNPAAMAARTDALTELGRFDEAIDSAQEFVNTRPNAASYTRVAHLRSLHGETESAIEARIQVIKMADPSNREAYAWYVSRLGNEYLLAGDLERSGKAFERALEVFPGYHWALAGQGKVLAKRGDLEDAVQVYENLIERAYEPGRAIFLGDLYIRLGRKQDAVRTYQDVVLRERSKEDPDLHRIALFWADNDANLEEALKVAQTDSEENDDLAASDTYAWTLFKTGAHKEARQVIKRAMRTGVRNPLFLYHSGMIEKALGNREKAKQLLSEAIRIDPEFDLIQAGKAIQALRDLGS